MEGLGNDLNTEEPIVFTMDEEEKEEDPFVPATSEGGDAPQVTFVDDCLDAVAVAEARPPPDEYETDSGDDFCNRGGRRYCACYRFKIWAANTCPFSA